MTYTTIQGDMWDSIAHKELGSVDHTGELMSLNPENLDYYIFPAGVVLKLPSIAAEKPNTLPPWKQVSL